MSLRRTLSHHLPDRCFHQIEGKLVCKSARHLADRGHVSPGPHLVHSGGNVSKGGKRLAPGVQEDQVVVATFGQGALGANPEDTALQAYEPAGGFRFGEVTISPFVILHACLGDERFVVCQRSHDIRQVVMGGALKRVANREWHVLWY